MRAWLYVMLCVSTFSISRHSLSLRLTFSQSQSSLHSTRMLKSNSQHFISLNSKDIYNVISEILSLLVFAFCTTIATVLPSGTISLVVGRAPIVIGQWFKSHKNQLSTPWSKGVSRLFTTTPIISIRRPSKRVIKLVFIH